MNYGSLIYGIPYEKLYFFFFIYIEKINQRLKYRIGKRKLNVKNQ